MNLPKENIGGHVRRQCVACYSQTMLDGQELELPPEMLLDETNPANDAYFQQLNLARAAVNHQSARMRMRHIKIVRLAHQSIPPKDIAKSLGVCLDTVYKTLRREDARRLLQLLQIAGGLIEGPSLELRKNMLWRMATTNEQNEPSVTIACLKELNKMDGAYPQQSQPLTPNINITINQDQLPRTVLDGELE